MQEKSSGPFVSLHNNSGDDSGYEIYYPNNHYVSEFNDIGYCGI